MIGDRFNRLKLIGVASVVWSIMAILAGFADGFWSLLLLVAFAITIPQTLYSPSAFATVAKYHRETRTLAMSCLQGGFYTGWLLSGVSVAAVLAIFGSWRFAYFIFGTLGLVLGLVFLFAARHAPAPPRPIHGAALAAPSVRRSLKAFFGCPSALLAASGHVTFTFVAFGYTAWAPKFVALKFGITPGDAGTGVMFYHFVAAFASILVSGWLTDQLVGRFPRFRLALQFTMLLLAAPLLAALGFSPILSGVWVSAALLGVAKGLFEANSINSIYDVVPDGYRASAVGYLNVLCGIFGSFAPILMGVLSQHWGVRGLSMGFALFGVALVIAAALMMISFFFTFRHDQIKE